MTPCNNSLYSNTMYFWCKIAIITDLMSWENFYSYIRDRSATKCAFQTWSDPRQFFHIDKEFFHFYSTSSMILKCSFQTCHVFYLIDLSPPFAVIQKRRWQTSLFKWCINSWSSTMMWFTCLSKFWSISMHGIKNMIWWNGSGILW